MYRFSAGSKQFAHRSDRALTNDQIARYAPSILATEAHASRGERYAFIPTIDVLDGLRAEGFQPFEVRQTKVRDVGRREHTKHMVRLRHANALHAVGTEVPEIILINSHDGSSSYQLLSGIFRMVCSNGLIAGDVHNDVRVRHTGNVVNDVIEGSFEVLQNLQQVTGSIDAMRAVDLTDAEQRLLAAGAIELRWGDESPVKPQQLITPRRYEDNKSDLWTTFNRIQENLVKGGVRGRSATGRRTTTREVGGVNENVKLNRALWQLAEGMRQLKGVAA
jgi:hypothetical protein